MKNTHINIIMSYFAVVKRGYILTKVRKAVSLSFSLYLLSTFAIMLLNSMKKFVVESYKIMPWSCKKVSELVITAVRSHTEVLAQIALPMSYIDKDHGVWIHETFFETVKLDSSERLRVWYRGTSSLPISNIVIPKAVPVKPMDSSMIHCGRKDQDLDPNNLQGNNTNYILVSKLYFQVLKVIDFYLPGR